MKKKIICVVSLFVFLFVLVGCTDLHDVKTGAEYRFAGELPFGLTKPPLREVESIRSFTEWNEKLHTTAELTEELVKQREEMLNKYDETYFESYGLLLALFAYSGSEAGFTFCKCESDDQNLIKYVVFDVKTPEVCSEDYNTKMFLIDQIPLSQLNDASELEIRVHNTMRPGKGSCHYQEYEEETK